MGPALGALGPRSRREGTNIEGSGAIIGDKVTWVKIGALEP